VAISILVAAPAGAIHFGGLRHDGANGKIVRMRMVSAAPD
jgi:hypothetical protein